MKRPANDKLPPHHDPHFTFRFADHRAIARLRLEGGVCPPTGSTR